MITILREVNKNDVTGFLKDCLDKIQADSEAKYYVEKLVVDYSAERVEITLDGNAIEPALAEVGIKEVYGEIMYYDAKTKLFEIGGYECDKISARTISGVMKRIEKDVRNWK